MRPSPRAAGKKLLRNRSASAFPFGFENLSFSVVRPVKQQEILTFVQERNTKYYKKLISFFFPQKTQIKWNIYNL